MDLFSQLPVLRLKRKRTDNSVDALHVRVNPKRRRTRLYDETRPLDGSDCHQLPHYVNVFFRRVQVDEAEHLLARTDTRVIDVPAHVIQQGEQPVPDQLLCNGTPMERVAVSSALHQNKESERACCSPAVEQGDSQELYDVYTLETDGTAYDEHPQTSLLSIDADDISLFDDQDDDNSESLTSDEDAKTVDYPSTPQHSLDDSLSQASSLENDDLYHSHGSQCDVSCACGMGIRDVSTYAYDPYYDDSADDFR
ncbi:hypothetical protein FGB62_1g312 [Gracilaria domingensis]|nr:hypothetical protein FGB62_1g312 [Gracilaria domingensis]